MTVLFEQAIDSILTHTNAVIEGDDSNNGIPGVHSNDELLKGTFPSALAITATGATGTTVVEYSGGAYASSRWSPSRSAPFFLLCTSATNTQNVGAARKISAWAQATTEFTTAAFPANLATSDEFYLLEGFRAVEDDVEAEVKHDRRFTVDMVPGEPIDIYGDGTRTVKSELVVSLSLKAGAKRTTLRRSALANGELLRSALLDPDNWESTYTRALIPNGSEVEVEEDPDEPNRMVVDVRLPIVYKYNLTME